MSAGRIGWLVGAVALVMGCTREPNEGTYRLTADQVFQDDCGLVGSGGVLWDAQLRRSGDLVMMPTQFYSIELRGYYLVHSNGFALEGTGEQVQATVRGASCNLDWVGVHLEGTPTSDTSFAGGVRVAFQSIWTDACKCQLDAQFSGILTSTP
jgi:hypothetical protein